MKKWRKRFFVGFLLLLLVLIGSAIVLYVMSYGRASWYGQKLSAEELKKNFQTASAKLVNVQNWAQNSRDWPAQSSRAATQSVNTDPTNPPSQSQTITLSQDELNSILDKYEKDLLAKYGQYISDPYIAIYDGRLVLAVTLKDGNRPLSVHIEPALDDKGLFILRIDHLQVGRLTVPRGLWGSYLDKLAEQLAPKVETSRQGARMEANGMASADAVTSALDRLLLNSLRDKGSDAVLFLPADVTHMETGYPVKVTDIKISEKALTLTLVTLNKQEQDQLLARVRAPLGEEPEPPITAPKKP